MASSSFLEIEKLKNNENAQITITGFNALTLTPTLEANLGMVKGYITDNTSFQFSHEFSSPNNTLGEFAGSFISTAGKISGSSGKGGITQRILTSAIGTMQNWKGASPFGFSIPTIFVASSEASADNPMNPVKTLMQAVLPRFEKLNHTGGFVEQMISPNNYAPGDIDNPQGTFSLKIGRWFNAVGRPFIIKDVQFEMSKEVIRTGVPLYVRATISFETYRVFPIEDVQSWMSAWDTFVGPTQQ